jgi:hypothetical protein
MGYRSDVIIVLRNDVVLPDDIEWAMREECGFVQEGHCEGHRLYKVNQIKWYADSPDEDDPYHPIWMIVQFLNSLKFEQYRFFRIGEDASDIDYEGGFYEEPFCVGIIREFSYEPLNDR